MIISRIRKLINSTRSLFNNFKAKELKYQKEIWKKLFNDRVSKDEFACELQEHLNELMVFMDKIVLRSFVGGIALGIVVGLGVGKLGWL